MRPRPQAWLPAGVLKGLEGVWTREGAGIVKNAFGHLPDITKTHPIPYDVVGISRYMHPNGWINTFTSRGCPGECNFCSIYCLDPKRWTSLPAERVVDDLDRLVALGLQGLQDHGHGLLRQRQARRGDLSSDPGASAGAERDRSGARPWTTLLARLVASDPAPGALAPAPWHLCVPLRALVEQALRLPLPTRERRRHHGTRGRPASPDHGRALRHPRAAPARRRAPRGLLLTDINQKKSMSPMLWNQFSPSQRRPRPGRQAR